MTFPAFDAHYTDVRKAYSPYGLPSSVVFSGGWINFGFWKALSLQRPTARERVLASAALYDEVFKRMAPTHNARALEVGCGKGLGCFRLLQNGVFGSAVGVDVSHDQITAAGEAASSADIDTARVTFMVAPAELLPFEDGSFTHVYSVEALQHFQSVPDFARQASRVLVSSGELVITTFFATSEQAVPLLAERLPTVSVGLDRVIAHQTMLDVLRDAGFIDISWESIGEHVFAGFDRWIELWCGGQAWGRNWHTAFQEGLLDYLIVRASARPPTG